MSAAAEAYAAAEALIATAKIIEWNSIHFDFDGHENLERIPPEIAELELISQVDLSGTAVSDLTPLQGMTQIQKLYLSRTAITDITPLSGLTALQILYLRDTSITDISPLADAKNMRSLYLGGAKVEDLGPLSGMSELRLLDISNTKTRDLSPLLALPNLAWLDFKGTPAAKSSSRFAEIAEIDDRFECARKTLDRLFFIENPPNPSLKASVQPRKDTPQSPGGKPAPVMVRLSEAGQIIAAPPDTNLETAALDRAEEAWRALRNYLSDLADLRSHRLHNMPALSRAFTSFERALGDDFAALNQIDLGMQADRIRRLAAGADQYLMDEDPEELSAFTAALSLYMRRFNAWDAYQNEDPPTAVEAGHLKEDRKPFQDIKTALAETEHVDTPVASALEDVIDAGTDPDATDLDQRGALDSMSNVLGEVAEHAMDAKETLGEKFDGFCDGLETEAGAKAREDIYNVPGSATVIWLVMFLFNNRTRLEYIAARYPERFGFLMDVLRYLFP